MTRRHIRAWLDIQRERIAHAICPEAFVKGWKPSSVTRRLTDDDLRREMEALNAERAALDARRAFSVPPKDQQEVDAVMVATQLARIIEDRFGGPPRMD